MKSHRRNFDAATPIRFTTLSCRRQCYYACGRSSKKNVCSHLTATAKTEFQSTIELRAMATEIAAPKGYKRHCNAFCNTRFQNNIVQEHAQHIQAARQCGLLRGSKPARTRLTKELPFRASTSHFPQKNNVSRSGILAKTSLLQHSCRHYNAISTMQSGKPECIYAHLKLLL